MMRGNMKIYVGLVLLLANLLVVNSFGHKGPKSITIKSGKASKDSQLTKARLTRQCPPNCFNNTCDSEGVCHSCIVRKSGPTCDTTCTSDHCATCGQQHPGMCLICVAGRYCRSCSCNARCYDTCVGSCNNRGHCFQCIEGKWSTEGCLRDCPPNCHGQCILNFGDCVRCKAGKYDRFCDRDCSAGCRHRVCNQHTGTCSLGCEDGWWGDHCNIPCSPNCVDPGYCNRADGSCNCKERFHGNNCSLPCTNCGDRGQCHSGGRCHVCIDGFYGAECKMSCPDYCATCDRWSGQCTRCKANDKWGLAGCNKQCNPRCQVDNKETCNIVTGKCYHCPPGYCGDQCQDRCPLVVARMSQECPKGYFGPNCKSKCPENCWGKLCRKEAGTCIKCRPGWTGVFCTERCPDNHTLCNGSADKLEPGIQQESGPRKNQIKEQHSGEAVDKVE